MPKFVKFQRGSQAAYDALVATNPAASSDFFDTLYFIYDKTHPEDGGLLYLGDTLIGGTGVNIGSTDLASLTDVDLSDLSSFSNNGDGALLQYNALTDKWEPISPSNISAGSSISVNVGTLNSGETVRQAQNRLNLYPNENFVCLTNEYFLSCSIGLAILEKSTYTSYLLRLFLPGIRVSDIKVDSTPSFLK